MLVVRVRAWHLLGHLEIRLLIEPVAAPSLGAGSGRQEDALLRQETVRFVTKYEPIVVPGLGEDSGR